MSLSRHHGSRTIRNALFRVFVLPNLSADLQHPTSLLRNIHFGSAEELVQQLNRRKAPIRTNKLHPDIIEADFFPTVSLVLRDPTASKRVQERTLLPQLRQRLRKGNAAKANTSDHEHLVMLRAPVYEQGREPRANDLVKLRAPESWIKGIQDADVEGAVHTTATIDGGTVRLAIPIEEPLVKIVTGAELLKSKANVERTLKDAARREKQEKEIELTWTIKDNDLVWSLNRIKEWLSEGLRVTVTLTRKRKWVEPDENVCLDLVEKLQTAASSIPDVRQQNISKVKSSNDGDEVREIDQPQDPMRGLGRSMTLYFTPKPKPTTLKDTVNQSIPWQVNENQLKKHLKVIMSTLKRGRNLSITLEESQIGRSKDVLSRKLVLSAIRSECRQAKDAKIRRTDGDLQSLMGKVVIEVQADIEGDAAREIEINPELKSKDAALRLKWLEEWYRRGLQTTVWIHPDSDVNALNQTLQRRLGIAAIREGARDPTGQASLIIARSEELSSPSENRTFTRVQSSQQAFDDAAASALPTSSDIQQLESSISTSPTIANVVSMNKESPPPKDSHTRASVVAHVKTDAVDVTDAVPQRSSDPAATSDAPATSRSAVAFEHTMNSQSNDVQKATIGQFGNFEADFASGRPNIYDRVTSDPSPIASIDRPMTASSASSERSTPSRSSESVSRTGSDSLNHGSIECIDGSQRQKQESQKVAPAQKPTKPTKPTTTIDDLLKSLASASRMKPMRSSVSRRSY